VVAFSSGDIGMMITVSELEELIARTPDGEQVQFETKSIGSAKHVTSKLTELKLSRDDPHYLIFVGLDRFGECTLIPFSTIGDPLEFRSRHRPWFKQRNRRGHKYLFPVQARRLSGATTAGALLYWSSPVDEFVTARLRLRSWGLRFRSKLEQAGKQSCRTGMLQICCSIIAAAAPF
jgi:hypothetical protein